MLVLIHLLENLDTCSCICFSMDNSNGQSQRSQSVPPPQTFAQQLQAQRPTPEQRRRFRFIRAILVLGFCGLASLWTGYGNWTKDDPSSQGWFYQQYGQRGNAIAWLIMGVIFCAVTVFLMVRMRRTPATS